MEHTIEQALTALSSVDQDHALVQNGVGFNGTDTEFGNSLAEQLRQGRTLSDRQRAAAYRMLRKYTNQLRRAWGIEYPLIPEPVPAGQQEKKQLRVTVSIHGREADVDSHRVYSPELVEALRAFPVRRWDTKEKVWHVSLDAAAVPMLKALIERFSAELLGDLEALEARLLGNIEASRRATSDLTVEGLGSNGLAPYPYQLAGIEYAVENRHVLIGDQMGLGKTVQALGVIEHEKAFPALVVCPPVVLLKWALECSRWLPHRRVQVIRPGPLEEVTGEIVLVGYSMLPKWSDVLASHGFKAVVGDESHYIKSRKAQRTVAFQKIVKQADIRLLLTGTPVLNRPSELVQQLQALDRLKEFGGAYRFLQRYCEGTSTGWGTEYNGAHNLEELHTKLRATCYVRRVKTDVLKELPPKLRPAVVPLEIDDRAGYERIEKELREWFREQVERDQDFLDSIAHLPSEQQAEAKKAYVAQRNARARAAEALVRIGACRQAAARRKVAAVIEWVEEFLASGRKLVIFAHHKEIIDAVAGAFPGCVTLTGADSADRKFEKAEQFQNDDAVRLIVANIVAGGLGIDLYAASDVAFVELPWRPGDLSQAEDRCHRIGQHFPVQPWYLLADRTIEEQMAELLDAKRDVVDAVSDGTVTKGVSILKGLVAALGGAGYLEGEGSDTLEEEGEEQGDLPWYQDPQWD